MKNIITTIIFTVLTVIVFLAVSVFAGCTQRICEVQEYTKGELTKRYFYKSNNVATQTFTEGLKVKTPEGTVVEFERLEQDNDSIKAVTPYGVAETERKGNVK